MYGHRYTTEEKEFFRSYIPGHTYKEIQEAFRKRFGWGITINQVKGYMANHKINNGLTGRFPKGHTPYNKGRKGICADGCEKGWFRKGGIPKKHRPVGSERITKDGYIEIKVEEPNKWRLKHRVIWENAFGFIPKGKCILFLNGDKTDVRIENLMLIDRKVNARMNQSGLRFDDPDSTKAAVTVAKLLSAIGEAKQVRKKRRLNGDKED